MGFPSVVEMPRTFSTIFALRDDWGAFDSDEVTAGEGAGIDKAVDTGTFLKTPIFPI